MRSFEGCKGTQFLHNGDFSGNVIVVATPTSTGGQTRRLHVQGERVDGVEIPVEDILALVADCVRSKQMEDDDILSLLKGTDDVKRGS